MSNSLRAGVIGASGIGKHHVKWLKALGCDVAAIAGTSTESVEATSRTLADQLGFSGKGYEGAEAMLDGEELDLVAICSPPWNHPEHLLAAVARGCHVLCEKPVAWDPDKSLGALLGEALEMVQAARGKDLVAAVNTQYAAAAEPYWELCEQAGAEALPGEFSRFFMQMDSRGGKQGAAGEKIWIDLASHPLSVLAALAGPGELVDGSEKCCIEHARVEAEFDYQTLSGRRVRARVVVSNVPDGPLVRRFGVDDVLVDYEGRNDDQGVYCAYLSRGDHEMKATDFMQMSISRFVEAVRGEDTVLASLQEGAENLAMQLRLLEVGRNG